MIDNNLFYNVDYNILIKEFEYYKHTDGYVCGPGHYNNIIKFFQQNEFFKYERYLFSIDNIKNKIINNRKKYLNKSETELTNNDILLGFKKSGIYYGYSHFNPLNFKWFINKYNCKICFDPCGGWGHRLLGSMNLDLYIYNDLSFNIYNNINRIIDFFNIDNTVTYNNDAYEFIPEENYDSMFTCPPYYNIEHYECGDFESYDEYLLFIDSLFYAFISKKSCKYFGIVIREDLLPIEYKKISYEKYFINNKNSKHINKTIKHKNNEYLYIYNKEYL